ncbi:MAG TPA: COX15/CtaA family protein [Pseudolysinimonas sp.]|nr:COX15/CtaA family protein [Pseudolysinimonas sp.]
MRTPLGWAASRWQIGTRGLRWATQAALIMSVLIVLGGGIVRVTGSGLGCPTWPTCDGTSVIVPIPDSIHLLIEQTNRMFTGLLVIAVGWAIVAARLQRPRDRMLTRLAWSQFWLVVANAVAGGITVLAGLNPWVVALHFVMAVALLATATLTWHKARSTSTVAAAPAPAGRRLAWALTATTLLLVVVGTIVSGSGPHSGDSSKVPRMSVGGQLINWHLVVWVHASLAIVVIVLAVILLLVLRRQQGTAVGQRRTVFFLAILLGQGLIGGVQSLIGLPELLVALHLLGAALVWVGALRVLLDVDTTLFRTRATASPDHSLPYPVDAANTL